MLVFLYMNDILCLYIFMLFVQIVIRVFSFWGRFWCILSISFREYWKYLEWRHYLCKKRHNLNLNFLLVLSVYTIIKITRVPPHLLHVAFWSLFKENFFSNQDTFRHQHFKPFLILQVLISILSSFLTRRKKAIKLFQSLKSVCFLNYMFVCLF